MLVEKSYYLLPTPIMSQRGKNVSYKRLPYKEKMCAGDKSDAKKKHERPKTVVFFSMGNFGAVRAYHELARNRFENEFGFKFQKK